MSIETIEREMSASFDDIVKSFARSSRRAELLRRFGPLTFVLAVQALLTLRLRGPVSADETLTIDTGHNLIAHWLHAMPMPTNPGSQLSGAPALYPILASALNSLGGIELVRAASLIFILLATVFVYLPAKELFSRPVAVLGSAFFATAGPILFLGREATFAAPALCLLAAGYALAVRTARRGPLWHGALAGLLLAGAATVCYVAAIFIPGVLLICFLAGRQCSMRRRLELLAYVAGAAIELVLLLGLTLGRSLEPGLRATATNRGWVGVTSLLQDTRGWIGPLILLTVLGAVVMAAVGRQVALAVALLATSLTAIVYHLVLGQDASLFEHAGFGLIFAAPLCSLVVFTLYYLARRRNGWVRFAALFAMAACVWVALLTGLAASHSFATAPVSASVPARAAG